MSITHVLDTTIIHSYSHITATEPSHIWKLWVSPETWPKWDQWILDAQVGESLSIGVEGSIRSNYGSRCRFIVSQFAVDELLELVVELPRAILTICRRCDSTELGFSNIHFTATLKGELSWLYARHFGPRAGCKLAASLTSMVRLAGDKQACKPTVNLSIY